MWPKTQRYTSFLALNSCKKSPGKINSISIYDDSVWKLLAGLCSHWNSKKMSHSHIHMQRPYQNASNIRCLLFSFSLQKNVKCTHFFIVCQNNWKCEASSAAKIECNPKWTTGLMNCREKNSPTKSFKYFVLFCYLSFYRSVFAILMPMFRT